MYTWTFNTLESLAYIPLITALFYVPVEFICAICIHKSRNKFLKGKIGFTGTTWKQWLFLFTSLCIIVTTIILPICFNTFEIMVNLLASMSVLFFPIIWMTALIYFFKQPQQHYYLGSVSLKSIFFKYVLFHILVVIIQIFVPFDIFYLLVVDAILSLVYLVLGGISLALGPRKKEAANKEDLSEQAN